MSVESIDINLDSIRRGSSQLRIIANNLESCSTALDAALEWDTFGLMCSGMLLPAYTVCEWSTRYLIDEAVACQDRLCEGLDASADSFEQCDSDIQQDLNLIGQQLP